MRWLLLVGSVLIVLGVGVLVYLRWGRRVAQPTGSPIAREAAYLEKRDQVRPLQLIKGSRPFTPQEMQILREASRDMTDFRLRCRALTALSYVKGPQQRKEAIELAVERLKDDEWVVRQYALFGLLAIWKQKRQFLKSCRFSMIQTRQCVIRQRKPCKS